jgi:light-harvesting complex 1 beta chain
MAFTSGSSLLDVTRGDRSLSFVAIFVTGFAVVLVLAIAGSALGLNWRSWFPGAEGPGSLFGSVTAAVYSFMSFLP